MLIADISTKYKPFIFNERLKFLGSIAVLGHVEGNGYRDYAISDIFHAEMDWK